MAANPNTSNVGSDIPILTSLVIQNNTGTILQFVSPPKNISGFGTPPGKIEAYRTKKFDHTVGENGSVGGVAYQVVDGNGKWIIAWYNVSNVPNKAYTKIVNTGERINWDDIFNNQFSSESVTNKSHDENLGFSATVVIDRTGDYPTLTAVLSPQ